MGNGHSAGRSSDLPLVAPSSENPCSPAGSVSDEDMVGGASFRNFCRNMLISQASIRLDCLTAGLSCSYDREP